MMLIDIISVDVYSKRKVGPMSETHVTTPTRFVEADGIKYAYRRWGKPGTAPLLFIQHFRAGMDHSGSRDH